MKKSHLLLLALPYVVYFLGAVANQAAVHANHGQMPVFFPLGDCSLMRDFSEDPAHVCGTSASHLKILADWIISSNGVSSIGDYMLELGDSLRIPALVTFVGLMFRDAFKR